MKRTDRIPHRPAASNDVLERAINVLSEDLYKLRHRVAILERAQEPTNSLRGSGS